jgi:hypothetical protein
MKYVSLKSTISFPLSSLENNFHVIIVVFIRKLLLKLLGNKFRNLEAAYGLRIQGKNMLNNIQI